MDVFRSEFISNNFPFIKIADTPQKEKTPNMIEVMAKSIYIMQDRITRQRLLVDRPDVLISPPLS